MTRAGSFLTIVILIATCGFAYPEALPGTDPNIIIVNPKDASISDTPIRTPLSASLSIGLPNTAGTGFLWTAKVENETVATCTKAKSIAVKKGNEPVVGFRTLDVFIINPLTVGTTTISFKLERPDGERLYSLVIPMIVEP
jgi:hypothetical protein